MKTTPTRDHSCVIDRLTTSIIHDLRNPLAAICGNAEMLLDQNLTRAQTRRVTINIHRAAARMRELLSQFACIARGCAERPEACDLREALAAACEAAAAEHHGVEIQLDVPELLDVVVVRTRMQSAFVNLIVNALEAMHYGGRIRISAADAGDCVRIAVEDDGPGIPAEIRTRLFEPFATAGKKDGLGLGLSLARQTVRDHGGELWHEPAAGARFVIALPQQSSGALADQGPRSACSRTGP